MTRILQPPLAVSQHELCRPGRRPLDRRNAALLVVLGFVVAIAPGCGRLTNQEAQEILETAILVTRSTMHTARIVELAAAATPAQTSAAAVQLLVDDLGKRLNRLELKINPVTCPCGGKCSCDVCAGSSDEAVKSVCGNTKTAVLVPYKPVCAAPKTNETGVAVELDFGPHCQGCAIDAFRYGGRLSIEPGRQEGAMSMIVGMSAWRADAAERFDLSYSIPGKDTGDPPTTGELDASCVKPPVGGLRGDQFDLEGSFRASVQNDWSKISLEYLAANVNVPAFTRSDRVNGLVHANLQTAPKSPPTELVLLRPSSGVDGGFVANGVEQWITGDAASANWFLQMKDAEIVPSAPLPRSGSFIIDAPTRSSVRLDFTETKTGIHVKLSGVSTSAFAGISREMNFDVAFTQ